MEIREATAADAPTANDELIEPGFRETAAADPEFSALDEDGVADAGIDRWLDDEGRVVFLAVVDGELAGYIAGGCHESPPIYERGDYTNVDGLYVKPDYRREGVGSALFERIEEWAATRNCEHLGVSAHVNNEAAVEMYDDDFERTFVSYRRPVGDESGSTPTGE